MNHAPDLPPGELPTAADLAHPRSLTDLLHYRIARLETFFGRIVTRLCEGEFGITRREWRFLGLLHAFGDMAPSSLAREASLDRGCTSKTLTTMLDKGLVTRQAVHNDARRTSITLTAQGHALHDEIFAALVAVNEKILSAVPAEDLPRFSALLNTMDEQAQQVVQSLAGRAPADRRHGGSRKRWETRTDAHPRNSELWR